MHDCSHHTTSYRVAQNYPQVNEITEWGKNDIPLKNSANPGSKYCSFGRVHDQGKKIIFTDN